MKIEDFKKDSMLFRLKLGGYLVNYDMPNDIQTKIVESISELEDKTEAIINQLEADKLELSKVTVEDNKVYRFDKYFCEKCGSWWKTHTGECIVNKANKYIKEVEK